MANEDEGDNIAPISIQQFLKGADYPASKEDLLDCAKGNNAPKEVLDVIQRMPMDEFGGPQDVQKGYGQAV